ncbi:MAG: hypothetical protein DI635_16130 [Pseudoxanthomonas suwonensis]|nr:MAG: hypothetical protein DI635_16130 [Pseudoxanthomonas suwonensis]
MSAEQVRMARHALGLPNERGVSYRNRYYPPRMTDTSPAHDAWDGMVAAGLAERLEPGSGTFYALTRLGAEAVLEEGEGLDPEDFDLRDDSPSP